MIPTFEGGTLLVTSFSDKMLQSEPVYSQPIGWNGVSWRLKVYPNGNGIVRDRYLSVFLELTSGPPGMSRLVILLLNAEKCNINMYIMHIHLIYIIRTFCYKKTCMFYPLF